MAFDTATRDYSTVPGPNPPKDKPVIVDAIESLTEKIFNYFLIIGFSFALVFVVSNILAIELNNSKTITKTFTNSVEKELYDKITFNCEELVYEIALDGKIKKLRNYSITHALERINEKKCKLYIIIEE